MSDRIFLRGIPVHARHGVFEEERRLGQRFVFDIDFWVEAQAYARADDPTAAVSYADVYDAVVQAAGEPSLNLIESVAERVAQRLLDSFAPIKRVRVEIHKPSAPIAGVFGDVGVEIFRDRDGAGR